MGGSQKSKHWALRFTTQADMKFETLFPDELREFLAYVCENGHDKPHYHVLIQFKSEFSRNAMDTMVNKFFPARGNANRSIKIWDGGIRALQYLYKESIPYISGTIQGILTPDEFVQLAREEPKKHYQRKVASYDELISKVASGLLRDYPDSVINYTNDDEFKTIVIDRYILMLEEMNLPPKNLFAMRGDVVKIIFSMKLNSTRRTLRSMILSGL